MNNKIHYSIIYFIFIGISFYFFDFTVDDAFITYRYSENLVNNHELTFNVGEKINAMTSPFHSLFSSILYYVFNNTVLSNKIVSILLLFISTYMILSHINLNTHLKIILLLLILFQPCIVLWTFAGLETIFLLFSITLTVILIMDLINHKNINFYLIYFIIGISFLIRYDSILFNIPIIIYLYFKMTKLRQYLIATLMVIILPLIWLLISVQYYGDLLPTSFYVKTPSFNYYNLLENFKYILYNLIIVGIIPMVLLLLWYYKSELNNMKNQLINYWWLFSGILIQLFYGLTMATTHMMFSFRFFVPYIPITIFLLFKLFENKNNDVNRKYFVNSSIILCIVTFSLFQFFYLYNNSVNGLAYPVSKYFNSETLEIDERGEYQYLGVRDYINFIQILRTHAEDIKTHYQNTNKKMYQKPRISTYAGGMLPYSMQEAYIYEGLVSFRHNQKIAFRKYADYIALIHPRSGCLDIQLPKSIEQYDLISNYSAMFDGSLQSFQVYYDSNPDKHILKPTIR